MLIASLWSCACTREAREQDASAPDGEAASEDGSADVLDAHSAGSPSEAAGDDASSRDAGLLDAAARDTGTMANEAAADAAQRDAACSAASCQPGASCDDDHPCLAPDTVCRERVCTSDPGAPASSWLRSVWSGRAGAIQDDDATLWCTPALASQGEGARGAEVSGQLQRVRLDGTVQHEFTSADVAQRVRFQCFASAALSGASTLVTSAWSSDAPAYNLC